MSEADRKAFMKQHASAIDWLNNASEQAKASGLLNDQGPPSYLPAREPLPPRIPDLCPDDANDDHGQWCWCEACQRRPLQ